MSYKEEDFRVKYIKNNNTIVFEKNYYHDKETNKDDWQWWYEVDMDDASPKRYLELMNHISIKTWAFPSVMDKFSELYLKYLAVKKHTM